MQGLRGQKTPGDDEALVVSQAATKAATDKAATDKAATDKAATDKAATDKAATDKAATDKAATDKAVELALARQLILKHGHNATCYQILNPGFERWFSTAGDAVVGFVTAAGYRVVAGSPVAAPHRLAAVVEEFEVATRGQGCSLCYFAADDQLAQLLATRGPLDRLLLGAQPIWRPASWESIVASKASLRAQLHRARNKKVRVERWPVERASEHEELQQCLQGWLASRGLPPLHFLVETDTLGRLFDRHIFVALQETVALQEAAESRVVGFLVASPIPARQGWLIEQNIRAQGAPNGTCELLLDAAFRFLPHEGAEVITLGLAPLSQRATVSQWATAESAEKHWVLRALMSWMRAHGRRFYNFDGLDAYKAKFEPESWEPIYAITGGRRLGLGTLYAIASAFGQMAPPKLLGVALARALRQEVRWMWPQ